MVHLGDIIPGPQILSWFLNVNRIWLTDGPGRFLLIFSSTLNRRSACAWVFVLAQARELRQKRLWEEPWRGPFNRFQRKDDRYLALSSFPCWMSQMLEKSLALEHLCCPLPWSFRSCSLWHHYEFLNLCHRGRLQTTTTSPWWLCPCHFLFTVKNHIGNGKGQWSVNAAGFYSLFLIAAHIPKS